MSTFKHQNHGTSATNGTSTSTSTSSDHASVSIGATDRSSDLTTLHRIQRHLKQRFAVDGDASSIMYGDGSSDRSASPDLDDSGLSTSSAPATATATPIKSVSHGKVTNTSAHAQRASSSLHIATTTKHQASTPSDLSGPSSTSTSPTSRTGSSATHIASLLGAESPLSVSATASRVDTPANVVGDATASHGDASAPSPRTRTPLHEASSRPMSAAADDELSCSGSRSPSPQLPSSFSDAPAFIVSSSPKKSPSATPTATRRAFEHHDPASPASSPQMSSPSSLSASPTPTMRSSSGKRKSSTPIRSLPPAHHSLLSFADAQHSSSNSNSNGIVFSMDVASATMVVHERDVARPFAHSDSLELLPTKKAKYKKTTNAALAKKKRALSFNPPPIFSGVRVLPTDGDLTRAVGEYEKSLVQLRKDAIRAEAEAEERSKSFLLSGSTSSLSTPRTTIDAAYSPSASKRAGATAGTVRNGKRSSSNSSSNNSAVSPLAKSSASAEKSAKKTAKRSAKKSASKKALGHSPNHRTGSGSGSHVTMPVSSAPRSSSPSTHGKKKAKQCMCCKTTQTPLWRDIGRSMPLCNACGIRYKKYSKICESCFYVPCKQERDLPNCKKCGSPQ